MVGLSKNGGMIRPDQYQHGHQAIEPGDLCPVADAQGERHPPFARKVGHDRAEHPQIFRDENRQLATRRKMNALCRAKVFETVYSRLPGAMFIGCFFFHVDWSEELSLAAK